MTFPLLKKGDVEGAIKAFEYYARKGKFLAGLDQLLTCVALDNNSENLQKVMDICKIRYKDSRIYLTVSKKLLEVGKRQQAKNMLETPGLIGDTKVINGIMNKFVEEKRLDCLEDFILFSKKVIGCDRDHMYLTWLNAIKGNPSTAEEILLEIQEEGHLPSKELRTKLAKVLKSGNRPIPFDVTDLKIDDIEVEKLKSNTATNKNDHAPLNDHEVDELVKSLKDYVTVAELKTGFRILFNNERFDKVAEVFNAIGFLQQTKLTRKYCDMLLSRLSYNLDNTQMRQFLDNMSYDTAKYLRRRSHYKKLQIKEMDTEAFLKYIKAMELGKDRGGYCLSPLSVELLIKKDPQFMEKLEELSNEGCGAATVVLARQACHQQNSQQFSRLWSLDDRNKKEVAQEMIIDPNNLESLKWISEAVNYDPNVLEIATNKCLKNDPLRRDKEILEFALSNGLSLDAINTYTLKKVSHLKLPEFDQHSDEIKRILNFRENRIT